MRQVSLRRSVILLATLVAGGCAPGAPDQRRWSGWVATEEIAAIPRGACAPAPRNLVGRWRGDEADEGDTAGIDLDGQSFVEVPGTPGMEFFGSITVEGWVFRRSSAASLGIIGNGDNARIEGGSWSLHTADEDAVAFSISRGGGERYFRRFSAPGSVPPYSWTHVAAISDGASITFFINGRQVDSQVSSVDEPFALPVPPPVERSGASWLIGAQQRNGTKELFYDGILDEMTVYSRALGATEIQAIYQAGSAGKCQGGLRFPWTGGETWYLTCGPHSRHRAALDFAPPNLDPRTKAPFLDGCSRQRGNARWVRAAAAGRISSVLGRDCPLVQIQHDDGTATNYFHLRRDSVRRLGLKVGDHVRAGQILGHPSCETGPRLCHPTQPPSGVHVHFYRTIGPKGKRLPADGMVISGWTVHAVGREREGLLKKDGEVRSTRGSAVGRGCPPGIRACDGQRNDLESDNER